MTKCIQNGCITVQIIHTSLKNTFLKVLRLLLNAANNHLSIFQPDRRSFKLCQIREVFSGYSSFLPQELLTGCFWKSTRPAVLPSEGIKRVGLRPIPTGNFGCKVRGVFLFWRSWRPSSRIFATKSTLSYPLKEENWSKTPPPRRKLSIKQVARGALW